MFQRILVPLDGSLSAEHALHVAAHVVQGTHTALILLQVVQPITGNVYGEETSPDVFRVALNSDIQAAGLYLSGVQHLPLLKKIPTEISVMLGETVPSILEIADRKKCDLIIMQGHQRSGLHPSYLGNTIENLVSHVRQPILILNMEGENTQTNYGHALALLDGSREAEAVLQPLQALLEVLPAPEKRDIHLLKVLPVHKTEQNTLQTHIQHCLSREYLVELQRQFTQAKGEACPLSPSISWSIAVQPNLIQIIRSYIEKEGYDLLALTTCTHQSHSLGWEAKHILHSIDIPLLFMPQVEQKKDIPMRHAHVTHTIHSA